MTIDYSISVGNILTIFLILVMFVGAFRKIIAFETKMNILWKWFEEHILRSAGDVTP